MNEKLQKIVEYYPEEQFLSADGFEDAIIGVYDEKLVYSIVQSLNILRERDGMSYEEAIEHFDYNVRGSYVGEKTPIWVEDFAFEE
jgi:hypothetical protein